MEQCSPFGMAYMNEEEGMMGELRQFLLQTRMEMEATVFAAQDEILKKTEEMNQIKEVLMLTIKERDEAQSKIQKLTLEKVFLQQLLHQQQREIQLYNQKNNKKASPASLSNSNTPTNCFSGSSSDSEESSIISSSPAANSPAAVQPPPLPPPLTLNPASATTTSAQLPPQVVALLASNGRPLPEKGKLLKAVMEAGPLLQTLLLAGPLPQWQHPPPRLNTIEIPPVSINPFGSSGKRGLDNVDGSVISPSPKYQRVS